jgi:hypothetical protein
VDEEGRRDLSPYVISYKVTDDRVPFTRDYVAVVNLTDVFLRGFFTDLFSGVNFATLDFFETFFLNAVYRRDQPIVMEYESTAFFDKESANIPYSADLDALLRQAFLGQSLANYTLLLQGLNETNPFSTTTTVTQMNFTSSDSPDTESQDKYRIIGATLASAAAVAALFAAGMFVQRRRRNHREDKSLAHGHFSFFGANDTLITEDETMALSTNPVFLAPTTSSPVQNVSYINDDNVSLAESATYTSDGEPNHHSRTQSFGSESSFDTIETDFLRDYAHESIRAVKVEPSEEKTSSVSEADEVACEATGKAEEPQKEEATNGCSAKEVEPPQEETASVGSNKAEEPPQKDATSIDRGNGKDTQQESSSTTGAEENLPDSTSASDEQKSTISEEKDVPESSGEAKENSSGDDTVPMKNPTFKSSKADA